MKRTSKLIYGLAVVFAAVLLLIMSIAGGGAVAHAANANFSILDDFSNDKNFNLKDYGEDLSDTGIYIIQLAETTDGELLVYAHAPAANAYDLTLKTIRFSTSYEGDTWKDYKLTLQSAWGVLFKYKVEGFTVLNNSTRYYNITAVHRPFDKLLDGGTITENKDSETAVKIAQLWTAVTANGTVTYSMEETQVVTVEAYPFDVRLKDGYNFNTSYSCDSHCVAFSSDVDIDKLLEADVSFEWRTVDVGIYDHPDYGEWYKKDVTVTYKEQGNTSGNHWSNSQRTWDRIMRASEYVSNFPTDLPEHVSKEIKQRQWVLSYYETKFQDDTGGVMGWLDYIGGVFGYNLYHYTEVSKVTILRLKFIKDGEVFNLGVVSNKSGKTEIIHDEGGGFWDDMKDKVNSFFKGLLSKFKTQLGQVKWWQWILIVVAALIVIPTVLGFIIPTFGRWLIKTLKAFGSWLVKALKKVLHVLGRIITAPFRFIKGLFTKK